MPAITFNTELEEASRRNNIPLVGIFFHDRLPSMVRQGGYIFNLSDHDSNDGGSHWTGAFVEGPRAIYFDPFGTEFNEPPENIKKFFSPIDTKYSINQIQSSESGICGYYVLYFLYYMTHRRKQVPNLFRRMEFFLKQFSYDPEENRERLETLLKPLK